MTRRGESVTLSLTATEKAELEKLALQFGCTWGDRANISALMKALASGQLVIHFSDATPAPEVKRKQAQLAINKLKQALDELGSAL